MGTMNHAKTNLHKRVAKQFLEPLYHEAKTKWLTLPFYKKFPDHTAPDLFCKDLMFFNWVVTENIIHGCSAYETNPNRALLVEAQVNDVADRAGRILPPGPDRELKEFVCIVDSDNVFERAVVVYIGEKPKLRKGSRIVKRSKSLNAFLPKKYSKPSVGFARMSECIDNMYFDVVVPNPARKRQVFFENDDNFLPKAQKGKSARGK
jgi:hypothetical protein